MLGVEKSERKHKHILDMYIALTNRFVTFWALFNFDHKNLLLVLNAFTKVKSDGIVDIYKTRLVAIGFNQEYGFTTIKLLSMLHVVPLSATYFLLYIFSLGLHIEGVGNCMKMRKNKNHTIYSYVPKAEPSTHNL